MNNNKSLQLTYCHPKLIYTDQKTCILLELPIFTILIIYTEIVNAFKWWSGSLRAPDLRAAAGSCR